MSSLGQKPEGGSLVEGGDDHACKAHHSPPSIDELGVAAEEGVALSRDSFEYRDSGSHREDEKGQEDRHGSYLNLLQHVLASHDLRGQGCNDAKHSQSGVGNLWNSTGKPANTQQLSAVTQLLCNVTSLL